jgi:branched-chain amino acid aminotransferase
LSRLICFNGNLLDETVPVARASNRSLRYGDGLFESMRWENGRLPLGDLHFERLFHGLKVLGMEPPPGFTASRITAEVRELCEKNEQETARIRLNVFREESPGLWPANNNLQYIIETAALPDPAPAPSHLGIYQEERKSTGILSNLKTNNYLLYILAAQQAKHRGHDDALILNTRDNICEATSSNVFFVKDRQVHTPPLSEGCVAGVMRHHLLKRLPELGLTVREIPVGRTEIKDMDELFLTNAIRGIRPVAQVEGRSFSCSLAQRLARELNGC